MDTNLKIIELVQRRPVLYTRCNNFPGRAHQWKEVADILKTDVPLVKSRWHLLRTRFIEEYSSVLKGNRTSFKYLSEMSFLSNHINLNAFEMYSKENEQYRTEPEFNITKEDLEDASDDDSTIEFLELELDDENQKELAAIPFGASEEVCHNEYVEPIYIDEYSNTSQSQEDEEMSPNNKEKHQQVEMFIEVPASAPASQSADTSALSSEDSKIENAFVKEAAKDNMEEKEEQQVKGKQEEQQKKEEKQEKEKPEEIKTNDTELEKTCTNGTKCSPTKSEEEKTPTIVEKPISSLRTENFRCEDTIFGELVAATLRQMQSDKKKTVKREIMNLLFT